MFYTSQMVQDFWTINSIIPYTHFEVCRSLQYEAEKSSKSLVLDSSCFQSFLDYHWAKADLDFVFFFCPRFGPMFSSCVPETNSEWIRIVYSLYFQLIELFLSWHFCLRVGPRLKLFSLQKEQLTSKLDDTSHSRMVSPIVSYATSYHIHITSYKSTKSIQIIPMTISYHTPYHMLVWRFKQIYTKTSHVFLTLGYLLTSSRFRAYEKHLAFPAETTSRNLEKTASSFQQHVGFTIHWAIDYSKSSVPGPSKGLRTAPLVDIQIFWSNYHISPTWISLK